MTSRRRRVAVCGTDSGYSAHRRKNPPEAACDACKAAHAAANRSRAKPKSPPAHGTLARYRGAKRRKACHCDLCRAAYEAHRRDKRHGHHPESWSYGKDYARIRVEDDYGITRAELEAYRGGL